MINKTPLDTNFRIFAIISIPLSLTPLSLRATVGKLLGVVVAAALVVALEVTLHALSVAGKFLNPGVFIQDRLVKTN